MPLLLILIFRLFQITLETDRLVQSYTLYED